MKLDQLDSIVSQIKSVAAARDPNDTIDVMLKLARTALGTPALQRRLQPYTSFLIIRCIRTPLEQAGAPDAMLERMDQLSQRLAGFIAKNGMRQFWLSWVDVLKFVADPAMMERGIACLEGLIVDDTPLALEVEEMSESDDDEEEDGADYDGIRLATFGEPTQEVVSSMGGAHLEIDEELSRYFARYDLDDSGTITDEEDLEAMHTCIVYQFITLGILEKTSAEDTSFQRLCAAADITNTPLDLNTFIALFRSVHSLEKSKRMEAP